MEQTSLRLTVGSNVFGYRVAGVAFNGDRVLLHKSDLDGIWALPGGGCHFGDDAKANLVRELREELNTEIEVEDLAFVIENFFNYDNRSWHEVGHYFRFKFLNDAFYKKDHFVGTEDQGDLYTIKKHRLHFEWIPLEHLHSLDIRPRILSRALIERSSNTYLIQRDEGN